MRERVYAKRLRVKTRDPVSGEPKETEIVDLRSTPTHFLDADDGDGGAALQIRRVLDEMHRILKGAKAELIVQVVDEAVLSLAFRPAFTYQDVALALSTDARFAFQGGLVSLAGEADPWSAYQMRISRN